MLTRSSRLNIFVTVLLAFAPAVLGMPVAANEAANEASSHHIDLMLYVTVLTSELDRPR